MTIAKRAMSIENFQRQAIDPNNKTILDPYTFFMTDLPYYLRNSPGVTRRISRSTAYAPDLISYVEYGTHDFWWGICIANRMTRGEREIEPGIDFYVPSSAELNSFIVQAQKRKVGGKIVVIPKSGPTLVTYRA
jgi:hypothetical protein